MSGTWRPRLGYVRGHGQDMSAQTERKIVLNLVRMVQTLTINHNSYISPDMKFDSPNFGPHSTPYRVLNLFSGCDNSRRTYDPFPSPT